MEADYLVYDSEGCRPYETLLCTQGYYHSCHGVDIFKRWQYRWFNLYSVAIDLHFVRSFLKILEVMRWKYRPYCALADSELTKSTFRKPNIA